MRRLLASLIIAAAAAALAAGCGSQTSTTETAASRSSSAAVPAVSKYDSGPRAGESEADEAQAKEGEKLFSSKGCTACHTFGKKMSGPDLAGVSMRRTALWMENQILHPDVMVKEDPIARQLFAAHALQMPNQGLTRAEALAVIEYLKHRDHEAGEDESKDESDSEEEKR